MEVQVCANRKYGGYSRGLVLLISSIDIWNILLVGSRYMDGLR